MRRTIGSGPLAENDRATATADTALPLVLYFRNDAERESFIRTLPSHMRRVKLP